jgi:hypothetical protein
MSNHPARTAEERCADLEKQVGELKQKWSRLKWAVSTFATAFVIATGVGVVKIPAEVIKETKNQVTPIAQAAAKAEAENTAPALVRQQLENQKDRATQAANAAEAAMNRVGDIEKKIGQLNLVFIDASIRKLNSLADRGLPKAYVYCDHNGKLSGKYNIKGVSRAPTRPGLEEILTFDFETPPTGDYTVLISLQSSNSPPAFVRAVERKPKSFNVHVQDPKSFEGIAVVVFSN